MGCLNKSNQLIWNINGLKPLYTTAMTASFRSLLFNNSTKGAVQRKTEHTVYIQF